MYATASVQAFILQSDICHEFLLAGISSFFLFNREKINPVNY